MTITKRNIFLLISILFLLLLTLITASVPFLIQKKTEIPFSVILYSPDFLMPVILMLFSVISLFLIRYSFLKTNSSEIFFYSLFLISLMFDLSDHILHCLIISGYRNTIIFMRQGSAISVNFSGWHPCLQQHFLLQRGKQKKQKQQLLLLY